MPTIGVMIMKGQNVGTSAFLLMTTFFFTIVGVHGNLIPQQLPTMPIPPVNLTFGTEFANFLKQLDPSMNFLVYNKIKLFASAYSYAGGLECQGIDHITRLPIFKTLTAANGQPYWDLGGNDACKWHCDGSCVPYSSSQPEAPFSLYPWGCNCNPDKCLCGNKGPNPVSYSDGNWGIFGTQVTCSIDSRCQCDTMDSGRNSTGFLCNWMQPSYPQIQLNYPEELSAIRWCECCPYKEC